MRLLHHFVHIVPERNQRNVPRSRTVQRALQRPMSKPSKYPCTTIRRDTWEQWSSFYLHCWWYFVCCLPFIYIITTEVVSSISCIGISNIKNRRCQTCRSPFQSLHQIIHRLNLIHLFHRHGQNDYHKPLAM